jgi:hypothetical protein
MLASAVSVMVTAPLDTVKTRLATGIIPPNTPVIHAIISLAKKVNWTMVDALVLLRQRIIALTNMSTKTFNAGGCDIVVQRMFCALSLLLLFRRDRFRSI